jgi:K+-sensing histidine kinase KdpD
VHDLRSPVTNILSGLQTIKIITEEDEDETLDEIIDMAEISSNRLLTLINSILDISKFEQRSMNLNPEKVEIADLIEEAKSEVMQWANQEHMVIETNIETQFTSITVDKNLTLRTIINVLGNAIKYNKPGKPIIIRVYQKSESTVRFSIKDHGEGIPKEWQKKIFDKFAQIQTKQTGMPSTGLGLTFSREAITAQGGKIWVDDSFTDGTNILFFVPVDITANKKINSKKIEEKR